MTWPTLSLRVFSLRRKTLEGEDEEVLLTVAQKLDILAKARTVLDGIIPMPETAYLYFGRVQHLLRSNKALAARQTRVADFFVKK